MKTLFGFVFAGVSGVAALLAQSRPSIPGWVEEGAFVSLVICLIYAVVTLWRTAQRLQKENKEDRDKFHSEVATGMQARISEEREERKAQREALFKLSSSLDKLSQHIDDCPIKK